MLFVCATQLSSCFGRNYIILVRQYGLHCLLKSPKLYLNRYLWFCEHSYPGRAWECLSRLQQLRPRLVPMDACLGFGNLQVPVGKQRAAPQQIRIETLSGLCGPLSHLLMETTGSQEGRPSQRHAGCPGHWDAPSLRLTLPCMPPASSTKRQMIDHIGPCIAGQPRRHEYLCPTKSELSFLQKLRGLRSYGHCFGDTSPGELRWAVSLARKCV